MKYGKKNAKNKLSHILNVAKEGGLYYIWTSHKKTIKMIRLSSWLLELAPCKNWTTRVLFVKEVRTQLGANHFTSEGPRGSRGGEGWVNCCRHDFFFNPFICREFFLEVCICLIFFSPSNTLWTWFFLCGWGWKNKLSTIHTTIKNR